MQDHQGPATAADPIACEIERFSSAEKHGSIIGHVDFVTDWPDDLYGDFDNVNMQHQVGSGRFELTRRKLRGVGVPVFESLGRLSVNYGNIDNPAEIVRDAFDCALRSFEPFQRTHGRRFPVGGGA